MNCLMMNRLWCCCAAVALSAWISPVHAAIFNWDGGGANTNWSTAGNWTGGAPSSTDQNDLQFGFVVLESPFNTTANNTNSGFNFNSIGFYSTAGVSFSLTGSMVELKKDGSTQPTIEQHSSFNHLISAPLKIGGDSFAFTGNGTGVVTVSGGIETGGKAFTKSGSSTFIYTGTFNGGGQLTISGGTLGANANAANLSGRNILLSGGVLATSGSFTRALGTGDSQVRWGVGGGGFAAYGGALNVNIGSALTWGGSNFVPAGSPLIFGSAIANNLVNFQNAINLGASGSNIREIRVVDNPNSSADMARLSGVISNSGGTQGLNKTGGGILELTNANTYNGGTTVTGGTLLVNNSTGSGTGGGAVNVLDGATLGGSGIIAGPVTLYANAVLAPGNSPGTLAINNELVLDIDSILEFELNGADTTIGGGVNDLVTGVTDLTLAGQLFVIETVAGSFLSAGAGDTWRLFSYSGALTDLGVTFAALPALSSGLEFVIDTQVAGQVNLVVTMIPEPAALLFATIGFILIFSRREYRRA